MAVSECHWHRPISAKESNQEDQAAPSGGGGWDRVGPGGTGWDRVADNLDYQ